VTVKSKIRLNRLSAVEVLFARLISNQSDELDDADLFEKVVELWDFAKKEESACIIGNKLLKRLETFPRRKEWEDEAVEMERKISLYLEQLDIVASALAENGIRLVALKNSGIARGIHRILAECPMGDLDVLVRPCEFRSAHEVLLGLGYKLDDRSPFDISNLDEAEQHGGTEYTYGLSDDSILWFELQWRPVAGRWIQPEQEPSADHLLDRSVPIEGSRVRLLSPEDNLLQVCLHTAKHSYVRAPGFRLHTDVDRIVGAYEIDWELFLSMVKQMKVQTAVFLSLIIPKNLLGTSVPDEVLSDLDHSPSKHRMMERWLLRVGLFGPLEKKWSKAGYIMFNLLLYDDLRGVVRAVFPDASWMKKHYGIKHNWVLPFWHVVRIIGLLFRRAKT
jgi:hypothetical protein